MKQIITQRAYSVPIGSNWTGLFGIVSVRSAEIQARCPWMTAGTFRNFRVTLDVAPGAGTSWTLTIYKNGVATAVTVTISDTAVTASDTSNSFTVVAEDYLALRWVATGAVAAPTGMRMSLEFEGDTANESGYSQVLALMSNSLSQRTGVFWPAYQGSSLDTWHRTLAGSVIANIVPTDGSITGMAFRVSGSPGGGTKAYQCAIYKALAASPTTFVKQDGTGGTVDTRVTCADTTVNAAATFTLPVSTGDRVYVECEPQNTPSTLNGGIGITFTATTDGESVMGGLLTDTLDNNVTNYLRPQSEHNANHTTESDAEFLGHVSTIRLSRFHFGVATAPGSGTSWDADLRRDASTPSGAPAIEIADTDTFDSDLTHTMTVADGQEFDLRVVPTSLPTVTTATWSMAQTVLAAQIRASLVAGENTTVNVERAIAFGLDGNTNVHSESGKFKVFGDMEVTGTVTLGASSMGLDALSDVTLTSPAALDVLAYSGSAWVNSAPVVRYAEVAVTSPELLALRATPKTLVSAPGAGKVLEFIGAVLLLDATATAYVESAANLSIRYTGTTGAKVSDDIEATGFIDQTADTMTTARPKADAIVAKTGCENQLLCLHNLGAGEYTTGTGTMRVKVSYRVWTTGW